MYPSPISHLQRILEKGDPLIEWQLSSTEIQKFLLYYQLVLKWNKLLHLTTLTEPLSFAQRHLFESVFMVERLLASIRSVWDIGSGLGIPGLPVAILRPELLVTLVEFNRKKAIFLKEVLDALQLENVKVLQSRFELITDTGSESCLTVRALDKLDQLIPQLLQSGEKCSQFLFFGNRKTESALLKVLPPGMQIETFLIPHSQNRLLISLVRST